MKPMKPARARSSARKPSRRIPSHAQRQRATTRAANSHADIASHGLAVAFDIGTRALSSLQHFQTIGSAQAEACAEVRRALRVFMGLLARLIPGRELSLPQARRTLDRVFKGLVELDQSLFRKDDGTLTQRQDGALEILSPFLLDTRLLFMAPPEGEIPVEDVVRLLEGLIQTVKDAVRATGNGGPARFRLLGLIGYLERHLAYLKRLPPGSTVKPPEAARLFYNLGHWLVRVLGQLSRILTPDRWRSAAAAIYGVLRGFRPPGGSAAGGSQAGFVAVRLLWWIVLAYLSYKFGRWLGMRIGELEIGEETVHEHLAEIIFFIRENPPSEACQLAYERFVEAQEFRRKAQAEGLPKAIIRHFLEDELEALRVLVNERCDEGIAFWARLRELRLRQLEELGG